LTFADISTLLKSPIHEVRLSSLLVLIEKFNRSQKEEKESIANFYLSNTDNINNWDLVDLTAPKIAGEFWFNTSTKTMFEFANSGNLWKERIAIVSTYYFIKHNEFAQIIKLSQHFLKHKHDLIHKATGWMLREAGKQDKKVLYAFLDKYHKQMPRTMLRYSIEKLSEKERKKYMQQG
jgi:3-methyladenine DNA glycosylase AlkD